MTDNTKEMLRNQVLSIIESIENGYYTKDNLEVIQDNQESGTPWHIWNNEENDAYDDEWFATEEEAKEHLENCDGVMVSGYDYLSDVLDIEYICNGRKEYLGARVLVAFGGPNIWINTRNKTVEAYWWGDSFIESYSDDAMDLDSALEDLFNC